MQLKNIITLNLKPYGQDQNCHFFKISLVCIEHVTVIPCECQTLKHSFNFFMF